MSQWFHVALWFLNFIPFQPGSAALNIQKYNIIACKSFVSTNAPIRVLYVPILADASCSHKNLPIVLSLQLIFLMHETRNTVMMCDDVLHKVCRHFVLEVTIKVWYILEMMLYCIDAVVLFWCKCKLNGMPRIYQMSDAMLIQAFKAPFSCNINSVKTVQGDKWET